MIQRRVPERIDITLSERLIVRAHTETDGEPLSQLGNAYEWLRQQLAEVGGADPIDLELDSRDAITLYGVCAQGARVIIRY